MQQHPPEKGRQSPARQQPAQKPKRKKSGARSIVVLAVCVCGLFLIALGVVSLGHGVSSQSVPVVSGGAPSDGGGSSSLAQASSSLVSPDQWNFIGPSQQPQEEMTLVSPDYRMIALPENGRVDISYFDTATFVGDSITTGLEIYPSVGLPNAHYCAYKGVSPKAIYDGSVHTRPDGTKEVPMEALVASQPDNVYILMGANAMVNTKDELIIEYYTEMVRQIKANLLPGVGIYVQSITPVRPDNDNGFTMERINGLNNSLARLAYEEGCYFLDLNEPLAGDDGYLREDFAGYDGLHMSTTGYAAWVDYLVTHTAYNPRNPYIPGSPYYTTPALPASEEEAVPA